MHNKFQAQQKKYSYLSAFEESPISALERRNYNRVIDQLNSENQYLSKNMHQLIIENLNLKNKIYYTWDSTYTTKQNGKNNISEQIQRLEGRSISPEERKRPQKFTTWSQKQQPKEAQRYNSAVGSYPNRETIIEQLSESHFQSMEEVFNTKQQKRGIYLSKKLEKKQKTIEKMVKSLNNKKYKNQEIQLKKQSNNNSQQEKVSQTSRIIINIEENNKNNPEINTHETTHEKFKHKKDNSPYLVTTLQTKTNALLNHTPKSPSHLRPTHQHLTSSLKEKYSNTTYLTPIVR